MEQIETELERLNEKKSITNKAVITLKGKMGYTGGGLAVLKRRQTHQRTLDILENQLAAQQLTDLTDELRTRLQQEIEHAETQINQIRLKEQLQTSDQKILATYQQNLELHQEMLAGQRPYAPIKLLNEIIHQREALKTIDRQFTDF